MTDGRESGSSLREVDLFDGSQWIWGSDFSISPGIYVGMHDRQLYVQESTDVTKLIQHQSHKPTSYKKFPWRPYPATKTAVAVTRDENNRDNDNEVSNEVMEAASTTALSVLYNTEYINGS